MGAAGTFLQHARFMLKHVCLTLAVQVCLTLAVQVSTIRFWGVLDTRSPGCLTLAVQVSTICLPRVYNVFAFSVSAFFVYVCSKIVCTRKLVLQQISTEICDM